jgi:D-aminoacyl-tRNA deacylase
MLGVVVSRADEASEHLGEQLLTLGTWEEHHDDDRPDAEGGGTYYRREDVELRTFEELHLHLAGVAAAFDDPDLVAFASRHSGETGPLLTAHFTGNLGAAEYGGEDGRLATAAPTALDRVLAAFDDHAPEAFEVGVECTHHGPSRVGAPSLFVELGSGPEQWADEAAAEAVARAILALSTVEESADRTLLGVGGGHYARRFERVLRETDWAVGHVAADWGLDAMGDPHENRAVVRQLFEQSGAERALLDGDHPAFAAVAEELGYDVVSETWVRAVDGVDLGLAAAVEDELGTVESGVRFGEPAHDHDGGFTRVDLPDELLSEARGIDREATRDAVERHLLAFETVEGASTATGCGAVVDPGDREALVEELVALLAEEYDSVEREGEAVVAHERGFDPGKARELGVPEGPKFGTLSAGEPVEVDGRTVRPEDVTVERTHEFAVR